MNLRLDWCGHDAAMLAVKRWHYSRTMQAGKCAKLGVWEDDQFIGVVVFTAGSGSTTKWAANVGITRESMAELARVALTVHVSPVSRIIAIACKLLVRQSPGLRLIVSYADPREGHHGGIYQAGGWVYVGQTGSDFRYVDKAGREHHPRMACASGVKVSFGALKRVVKIADCRRVEVPGKHKYLLALDLAIRARIEALRKPYPKRVGSETGDTPTVQVGKGGSTPTPTLHTTPEALSGAS